MSDQNENKQDENISVVITIVIFISFWIYHGDFSAALVWFLVIVLLTWLVILMFKHPWYSLLFIVLGIGSCDG